MSDKDDKPHIYVIPEDDANRQIANGFVQHYEIDGRRIQVLPVANGWRKVITICKNEYVQVLRNNPRSHVVMMIDFDEKEIESRRAYCMQEIPNDIADRVFVLGTSNEPESLKIGFEAIGSKLADDCHAGTDTYWSHNQLRHNATERSRMERLVKGFLFTR